MSEPIEHRFYHEVLTPLVRFQARCAENVCIQENYNDVIVLAQEAATAAYHFPEAVLGRQTQMASSLSEALRQKLSDVVDSRKHGVLRNTDRQTSLQAALAYEFNEAQEFRYLGTRVTATNRRFGKFDVAETVAQFADDLRSELGIAIQMPSFETPLYPFTAKIVTYVTDKTFFAKNTQLQFFERGGDGKLLPSDPKQVHFEVQELTS
ncbi:hypothetical protein [Bradyrhizobium sp. dw_411]|uniref:hypothetical protein n=1 Tax=Bradyrhizobium sp. dw_411 TaxID=2720082 RepID=UPI001BCF07BE|nr:hypothetical protein [Bradyrhizobium sp. dw_411]